jgi:peptidyl-prolyl cis-trans isomerase A (cyclophilin A)
MGYSLYRFSVVSALLVALVCVGCTRSDTQVQLVTDLGVITLEVYEEDAPITAGNFLRYVDEDRYEGAYFYRVVTMQNQPDNDVLIEVIQGGLGNDEAHPNRLPPIRLETTEETGILHKDGVISMARNAPGTADAEIFICIGGQPELDFGGKRNPDGQGFAAFGKVIKGMDVVRQIQQQPEEGQILLERVRILSIVRDF